MQEQLKGILKREDYSQCWVSGLLRSSVPHGSGGEGAASAVGTALYSTAAPMTTALAVARPHILIAMNFGHLLFLLTRTVLKEAQVDFSAV